MPGLPFLQNLWACNLWAPEPEREVAVDTEALGITFAPVLDQIVAEPLPSDTGEDAELVDPAARHASLTADWPGRGPVIPASLHVTKAQDQDTLAFVNGKLSTPRTLDSLQCYHRADYQLHVAGFGTTGRPVVDAQNFQVLREWRRGGAVVDEIDVEATVGAVEYLKSALADEVPVLVGVRLNNWDARPNERASTPWIEPTNHYVVIVGMGQDGDGHYFSYYDYMHRPNDTDRLYLDESLAITGTGGYRSLCEVRRSWRK